MNICWQTAGLRHCSSRRRYCRLLRLFFTGCPISITSLSSVRMGTVICNCRACWMRPVTILPRLKPALTRRLFGCIRPARPAIPRASGMFIAASCILLSIMEKGYWTSSMMMSVLPRPSCSLPMVWEPEWSFPCLSVQRRSCFRKGRYRNRFWRLFVGIIRHFSSACRRCMQRCWQIPTAGPKIALRDCGCVYPPARRFPKRSACPGSGAWASISSTVLGQPKCCMCFCQTGRRYSIWHIGKGI